MAARSQSDPRSVDSAPVERPVSERPGSERRAADGRERSRSERRLAEALAADRPAAEPVPEADWEAADAAPRGSVRPKGGLAAAVERESARESGRKGKS